MDVKGFGNTLGSDVHKDIDGPTNPVSGDKARTDGTGRQLSYVLSTSENDYRQLNRFDFC